MTLNVYESHIRKYVRQHWKRVIRAVIQECRKKNEERQRSLVAVSAEDAGGGKDGKFQQMLIENNVDNQRTDIFQKMARFADITEDARFNVDREIAMNAMSMKRTEISLRNKQLQYEQIVQSNVIKALLNEKRYVYDTERGDHFIYSKPLSQSPQLHNDLPKSAPASLNASHRIPKYRTCVGMSVRAVEKSLKKTIESLELELSKNKVLEGNEKRTLEQKLTHLKLLLYDVQSFEWADECHNQIINHSNAAYLDATSSTDGPKLPVPSQLLPRHFLPTRDDRELYDRVVFFTHLPIFSALPLSLLFCICAQAVQKHYDLFEIVCDEDKSAKSLYVIAQGECEIRMEITTAKDLAEGTISRSSTRNSRRNSRSAAHIDTTKLPGLSASHGNDFKRKKSEGKRRFASDQHSSISLTLLRMYELIGEDNLTVTNRTFSVIVRSDECILYKLKIARLLEILPEEFRHALNATLHFSTKMRVQYARVGLHKRSKCQFTPLSFSSFVNHPLHRIVNHKRIMPNARNMFPSLENSPTFNASLPALVSAPLQSDLVAFPVLTPEKLKNRLNHLDNKKRKMREEERNHLAATHRKLQAEEPLPSALRSQKSLQLPTNSNAEKLQTPRTSRTETNISKTNTEVLPKMPRSVPSGAGSINITTTTQNDPITVQTNSTQEEDEKSSSLSISISVSIPDLPQTVPHSREELLVSSSLVSPKYSQRIVAESAQATFSGSLSSRNDDIKNADHPKTIRTARRRSTSIPTWSESESISSIPSTTAKSAEIPSTQVESNSISLSSSMSPSSRIIGITGTTNGHETLDSSQKQTPSAKVVHNMQSKEETANPQQNVGQIVDHANSRQSHPKTLNPLLEDQMPSQLFRKSSHQKVGHSILPSSQINETGLLDSNSVTMRAKGLPTKLQDHQYHNSTPQKDAREMSANHTTFAVPPSRQPSSRSNSASQSIPSTSISLSASAKSSSKSSIRPPWLPTKKPRTKPDYYII